MEEKNININQMNYNINMLETRIIDCLNHTDFKDVFLKFQGLNKPTIFVGSGGSSVATKFICSVVNEKNKIISEPKLPDEVWVSEIGCYSNMVVVSSGGMNHGARKSYEKGVDKGLNVYAMSGSKRIAKEGNIKYTKTIENEDSFISLSETLIPMAVALAYYIGDVEKTKAFVKDAFKKIEINQISYPISENYEIVGKDRFPTAAAFVESTMNESSIAVPTISGTYDMCHGRTTSVLQQKDREMIYLLPKQQSELDKLLHERLQDSGVGDRITDVLAAYNNYILDDFYLTLQMINLCVQVAQKKGIDLSQMSNSKGQRIHLTADSDAIAIWEEEHPGQDFFDYCLFSELTKKNKEELHSPGYYGPTGKYFEGGFEENIQGREHRF